MKMSKRFGKGKKWEREEDYSRKFKPFKQNKPSKREKQFHAEIFDFV